MVDAAEPAGREGGGAGTEGTAAVFGGMTADGAEIPDDDRPEGAEGGGGEGGTGAAEGEVFAEGEAAAEEEEEEEEGEGEERPLVPNFPSTAATPPIRRNEIPGSSEAPMTRNCDSVPASNVNGTMTTF